jgi:death-on-curing protein
LVESWHPGSCGALESALARRQTGYCDDIDDIIIEIEEAAALWESLSQNHAFLDGNKRVAVTVTAAFLKVNGYVLAFNELEAFSFLAGFYQSFTLRLESLRRGFANMLRTTTWRTDPVPTIDLTY